MINDVMGRLDLQVKTHRVPTIRPFMPWVFYFLQCSETEHKKGRGGKNVDTNKSARARR